MQKRTLGISQLEVSAIGLGCMRMSAGHGEVAATKDEMIALLRSAVEWGHYIPEKHATPAQIALAWLLAQKPWIVPIPGATRLARLQENIGAVESHLTPDELENRSYPGMLPTRFPSFNCLKPDG